MDRCRVRSRWRARVRAAALSCFAVAFDSDHDVGMTVAVFYLDQASERGARADVIVLLDAADPAHADAIAEARSLGMTVSPSATFTGGTERERVLNALTHSGIECIAVHAHCLEGRREW